MSAAKTHPFHLVEPSPWPVIGALSAFVLAIGGLLAMKNHGHIVLWIGTFMLIGTMVGWWHDIIKEAKTEHNPIIRTGFRYGMALFILSEVTFFAAFFWAYFDAALAPMAATGFTWPPKSIKTLDPFDLPYLNTLLLLLSGTTITWAHHAMTQGHMKDAAQKILYTVGLGALFLCVQMYEYGHAAFTFKDGIYPSVFYMATGFHGFHVFIGTCFLIVAYFRTKAGHFTADDHFGFEGAAWYWHFVDVVWLFLFISIYWWGSGS